MNDLSLDEIIIRLKLIGASLKVNDTNQAIEYLNILIGKYKMSDLKNVEILIQSSENKKATFLIEQIIKTYENIYQNIKPVPELEMQSCNEIQINQQLSNVSIKWTKKGLN